MVKNIFKFSGIMALTVIISVSLITLLYEVTTPVLLARELEEVESSIDNLFPENSGFSIVERETTDNSITNLYSVETGSTESYAYQTSEMGKNGEIGVVFVNEWW